MRQKNDRLSSLLEWAKSTYGAEIARRVAGESPGSETEFWMAINKVRAAHDHKYQSPMSLGKSVRDF